MFEHDLDVTTLVTMAVGGDERAWASLVNRYAPLVRSVVRNCNLRGFEADDVVQTVWLRMVEHLHRLREPRALPGWIVVTTRRECVRAIARSHRCVLVDALDIAEVVPDVVDDVPELDYMDVEQHTVLLAAFAELSERQRDVLLLLAGDPAPSYEQVSAKLGIPVGSIGPTRGRALKKLRRSPAIKELLGKA